MSSEDILATKLPIQYNFTLQASLEAFPYDSEDIYTVVDKLLETMQIIPKILSDLRARRVQFSMDFCSVLASSHGLVHDVGAPTFGLTDGNAPT